MAGTLHSTDIGQKYLNSKGNKKIKFFESTIEIQLPSNEVMLHWLQLS